MGALRDVELTEAPPEQAAAATTDTRVAVTIGCASGGALYTPYPFSSPTALASQFHTGTGVKAAVYSTAKSGKPGVFIAVPPTARNATKSAVDITAITGTLDPTVTGTPTDGYDVLVVCTVGGAVGTTGIMLKVSLDGGTTFATPVGLGTATTLVLTGTGLTLHFTSTKTVNANDELSFWTYPASATVLPLTTTRIGTSTCVVTVTGTPNDAYEVTFEVRTGGTIATTGIVVRYSLDGGRKWSADTALNTNTTLALQDGAEASGLTLAFAAGTLDAGDVVTFNTTAPQPQIADVLTALGVLKTSNLEWGFVHPVGEWSPADAGSLGTLFASWASGARRTFAELAPRDCGTYESDTAWSVRVAAQWAGFDDTRIAAFGGYSRALCPLTGRKNRRPVVWNAVARTLKRDPQVELGRFRDGVLESDVTIHDDAGLLVEHDGNANNTLANARFGVLRTYDRRPGIFFWIARVMGNPGEIQRLSYRRILDITGDTLRDALLDSLEDNLPRWGTRVKAPFKPGDIRSDEVQRLRGKVRKALTDKLVMGGMATQVTVFLNPTPVSIGPEQWQLNWTIKLVAPIYVDGVAATYGITDPALDALLNTPTGTGG